MNDTKYLPARHYCQEIMEAVIVDYWLQSSADHSDFHMRKAHESFTKLAEVLGRDIAQTDAATLESDRLRAALEAIDAVAIDYGHLETAARTMKDIALKALFHDAQKDDAE